MSTSGTSAASETQRKNIGALGILAQNSLASDFLDVLRDGRASLTATTQSRLNCRSDRSLPK